MRYIVFLTRNRFDTAAVVVDAGSADEATATVQRQIDNFQIDESSWELGADADQPVIVAIEIEPTNGGKEVM